MSRRFRAFVGGLALALLVGGCGIFTSSDTYQVIAYFPRAVSLYETGQVQVLGLPVGRISDIEIEGDRVKVTMAIKADVPLPQGVQAMVVPQSLIGERRIQLHPSFQEGDPTVGDGHVIGLEDTIVPTEPDEVFAALDEFLNQLDPDGLGRLIDNAAATLDGQGENLGTAIDELADLVALIDDNDDEIISIAERFDEFTTTLLSRESQLAKAIDDFSTVSSILAEERTNIEELIAAVADLAEGSFDIVAEHAVRLRTDIDIVTRLVASLHANLDTVDDLLVGSRDLAASLGDAWNENLQAINLRTNLSLVVLNVFNDLSDLLGIDLPVICFDVQCPDNVLTPILGPILGLGDQAPVTADLAPPTTPIDDILIAFAAPSKDRAPTETGGDDSRDSSAKKRGLFDAFLGTLLGVGS